MITVNPVEYVGWVSGSSFIDGNFVVAEGTVFPDDPMD